MAEDGKTVGTITFMCNAPCVLNDLLDPGGHQLGENSRIYLFSSQHLNYNHVFL